MTNRAGATKAQMAPFFSESQQLREREREDRRVRTDTDWTGIGRVCPEARKALRYLLVHLTVAVQSGRNRHYTDDQGRA